MIFEERQRVDGQERVMGTVFISVYRKQCQAEGVLFAELKKRIELVHRKYADAKILIGGDLNS